MTCLRVRVLKGGEEGRGGRLKDGKPPHTTTLAKNTDNHLVCVGVEEARHELGSRHLHRNREGICHGRFFLVARLSPRGHDCVLS